MKIVVASNNPVKQGAARDAFEPLAAPGQLTLLTASVPSGVSDQPFGDEDTRRGAMNRVSNACEAQPDADYWVGFEGGVDVVDGTMFTFAWCCVRARDGRRGFARTVTLPLPDSVRELVESGMELGEANDRVFGTHDSKRGGGAFGLLTDDRLTRRGVYTETLTVALIPVLNDRYE